MNRLLRWLLRDGFIDEDFARRAQQRFELGTHPVVAVVEQGIREADIAAHLAARFRAPRVELPRVWEDVRGLIETPTMMQLGCVPLKRANKRRLIVGMLDPSDMLAINAVRALESLAEDGSSAALVAKQTGANGTLEVGAATMPDGGAAGPAMPGQANTFEVTIAALTWALGVRLSGGLTPNA